MNHVLELMKEHRSVRSFTEEEIPDATLEEILEAGRAASSWKNFQSYSIILVRSKEKKEAVYNLLKQPSILESSVFLLFVGDLNRAKQAVNLHSQEFYPEGEENLLISAVDTALVGQNVLLAAESLGYGGVFIGLVRHHASELGKIFNLPDYTYPVFGMSLGRPNEDHQVKPRLPKEQVIFQEEYQEQGSEFALAYDQVQADYAGNRATTTWSERLVEQFGRKAHPATRLYLEEKKLREIEE